MRTFNYSDIKNQKWDSEILGLRLQRLKVPKLLMPLKVL